MEGWEESSSGPRKGVKGLIGRDWDNEGIGREKKAHVIGWGSGGLCIRL